jgi:hypothetical protein
MLPFPLSPSYRDDIMWKKEVHLNKLKIKLDLKSLSSYIQGILFDDDKSDYLWNMSRMKKTLSDGCGTLAMSFTYHKQTYVAPEGDIAVIGVIFT